jgi:hypothetical protein
MVLFAGPVQMRSLTIGVLKGPFHLAE